MNKYKIFSALLITIFSAQQLHAQPTLEKSQIKALLSMSDSEYEGFVTGTNKFDQQVNAILSDSSIKYRDKFPMIEQVLIIRRTFVKGYLKEDQLKRLLDFELKRVTEQGTGFYKQKQEAAERMKQRRSQMNKSDSTRTAP